MLAIFKREIRSYFTSVIGYVFLFMYLAVGGAVFCLTTLFSMSANVTPFYNYMLLLSAIILPLLTMKSFSEERKIKTEQLLLTSPVTITGMVLGKFFAAFTVYLGSLAVSLVNFIPLYAVAIRERAGDSYSVTHIGPVTGQIVGSFIGLVLVGAAFIAIGMFVSAFFEDQLAAAITTIGVILFMVAVEHLLKRHTRHTSTGSACMQRNCLLYIQERVNKCTLNVLFPRISLIFYTY
jgi:ABC-2 type transport system permease protein